VNDEALVGFGEIPPKSLDAGGIVGRGVEESLASFVQ
jgi:hypothetical protein